MKPEHQHRKEEDKNKQQPNPNQKPQQDKSSWQHPKKDNDWKGGGCGHCK